MRLKDVFIKQILSLQVGHDILSLTLLQHIFESLQFFVRFLRFNLDFWNGHCFSYNIISQASVGREQFKLALPGEVKSAAEGLC